MLRLMKEKESIGVVADQRGSPTIKTNVMGTFTLLDVARTAWKDRGDTLFHHVSTDEVYGSLGETYNIGGENE
ncbi:hypothetical protein MASR2M78_15810 [Treponema sp.]